METILDYFKPLAADKPSDILLFTSPSVGIYFQDSKTEFNNGSFSLTATNLFYQDSNNILVLELAQITKLLDFERRFLTKSPKLVFTSTPTKLAIEWTCDICQFLNNSSLKCNQCGVKTDRVKQCRSCTFMNHTDLINCEICNSLIDDDKLATIKISFRTSVNIEDLHALLQQSLDAKAWVTSESPTKNAVGVAGILKNLELAEGKRNEVVSQDSFQDLESLMQKAGEMAKLADILNAKLSQISEDQSSEQLSIQSNLLTDFGIQQPVTKKSSGTKFHKDLALELSKFLVQYSKQSGLNQISLSDAYCLFNRARGVALVSPDDLKQAANQLESLKLEFKLRTFDSGVNVLESSLVTDETIVNRVLSCLGENQNLGLTALKFAELSRISVVVSKEHLLLAEGLGKICRDDSIAGLSFFTNKFV